MPLVEKWLFENFNSFLTANCNVVRRVVKEVEIACKCMEPPLSFFSAPQKWSQKWSASFLPVFPM